MKPVVFGRNKCMRVSQSRILKIQTDPGGGSRRIPLVDLRGLILWILVDPIGGTLFWIQVDLCSGSLCISLVVPGGTGRKITVALVDGSY